MDHGDPDRRGARVATTLASARPRYAPGRTLIAASAPELPGHRLTVADVEPQEKAAIWPDIVKTAGETMVGEVEFGAIQGAVRHYVSSSCQSAVAAATTGSGWTAAP